MNVKLTGKEKRWIMYDVGNSAFALLVSTIIPIYFNYLAGKAGISSVNYLAYWGYAASICTIIVALLGPVCGTLADTKGFKKPVFLISILIGSIACAMLGACVKWLIFLIVFVIAKIGFSSSLIFYDSMLVDVTDEKRMDYVSSQGFAWGYIGSCIPFVGCLLLVLGSSNIGISMEMAMGIAFVIVAVWWLGESFKRLYGTCKNIKKEKHIFLFLLAFFFYIDGVYTIIDMATAYGSALGLDSTGLLLALLVTQIVAFPCAIIFGRLSYKVSTEKLILVCIVAYLGIAVFAIFLRSQLQFWILAILVGMFQGGIQALSRSYFTKIIPEEKNGEYFGLMDICGKGASFLGTTVVSIVSQLTGDINKGVGMIAVLFCIGIVVFLQAVSAAKDYNEEKAGAGITIDIDSVNVVKGGVVSENV